MSKGRYLAYPILFLVALFGESGRLTLAQGSTNVAGEAQVSAQNTQAPSAPSHTEEGAQKPLSKQQVEEGINSLGYESVQDFQRAMGLVADGVIGPKTTGALIEERVRRASRLTKEVEISEPPPAYDVETLPENIETVPVEPTSSLSPPKAVEEPVLTETIPLIPATAEPSPEAQESPQTNLQVYALFSVSLLGLASLLILRSWRRPSSFEDLFEISSIEEAAPRRSARRERRRPRDDLPAQTLTVVDQPIEEAHGEGEASDSSSPWITQLAKDASAENATADSKSEKPEPVPTPPPKSQDAEAPVEWKPGNIILDTYEVIGEIGRGGFGRVYKVHHREWDMDMAVKVPRPDMRWTQEAKEEVVRECHTWMDLGLHPHIVTCHYVQILGDAPCVFAEYVQGGSLDKWIQSERLYEGGPDKALDRILRIAFQSAYGLDYAHSKGLVHQDVKPANFLIQVGDDPSKSHLVEAKVSDFGLAKTGNAPKEELLPGLKEGIVVSGGGGTRAYFSPEQADIEAKKAAGIPKSQWPKLTLKTDLWSWAVSVLEMFTGGVNWSAGQIAGEALEIYLETKTEDDAIPPMPRSSVDLLRRCFRENPEDRPRDMREIADELLIIFGSVLYTLSPEPPTSPTELPDVLNNKALSFLNIGLESEAVKLWADALKRDPHHPESTYNGGLHEWRKGNITDLDLVDYVDKVRKPDREGWRSEYMLGLVHLERRDGEAAVPILKEALRGSLENRNIVSAIEIACSLDLYEYEGIVGALSVDGRWGLVWTNDEMVRVVDGSTGQCVRSFEGSAPLALSADGRWALLGRGDKKIGLWEVSTGRFVRSLTGHKTPVESASFSHDDQWIISVGRKSDSEVIVWEVSTGGSVWTLRGKYATVSADGLWVFISDENNLIRQFKSSSGKCVRTFELKGDGPFLVAGDVLWAISNWPNQGLCVWDVATGQLVRTFRETSGHSLVRNSLSANGRCALSAGSIRASNFLPIGMLYLWDVSTGKCVRTFRSDIDPLKGDFLGKIDVLSADGRWVFNQWRKNACRLCKVSTEAFEHWWGAPYFFSKVISTKEISHLDDQFAALLDRSKKAMYAGDCAEAIEGIRKARQIPGREEDRSGVDLWADLMLRTRRVDTRNVWLSHVYQSSFGSVGCISADGRWAVSAEDLTGDYHTKERSVIRLWDVQTGQCLRTFEGLPFGHTSISLSADGKSLLSGNHPVNIFADRGSNLRLWDVSTGQCVQEFKTGTAKVSVVSLSVDGRWALSGGDEIRLWDVATGMCVRNFKGYSGQVNSVVLSVDGRWALSGGDEIRLWDVVTGRCVRTFDGDSGQVKSAVLSVDSRWVLSGGAEIRLWDVATGSCVKTLAGQSPICLTADGRWAFSGSSDNTVRVWDLRTGQNVRSVTRHTHFVVSVSLSACAHWVFSTDFSAHHFCELDWELEAVEPADWDEEARPYLEGFLTLHSSYLSTMLRRPQWENPSESLVRALSEKCKPNWKEADFKQLLYSLGCAGYGWLRPEGVKRELEKMAKDWDGPPPLTGKSS